MLHARHPATFELPPRDLRENLPRGAYAKVILTAPDEIPERLWVEVREVRGEGRTTHYVGRLDNAPLGDFGVCFNGRVTFEPRHVIDVMRAPVNLRRWAGAAILAYAVYQAWQLGRRPQAAFPMPLRSSEQALALLRPQDQTPWPAHVVDLLRPQDQW